MRQTGINTKRTRYKLHRNITSLKMSWFSCIQADKWLSRYLCHRSIQIDMSKNGNVQAAGRKRIIAKTILYWSQRALLLGQCSGHHLCTTYRNGCQWKTLQPSTRRVARRLPPILSDTPFPFILPENRHRIQPRKSRHGVGTRHKINASGRQQDACANEQEWVNIDLQSL